jgi:hypothetical protein
VSPDLLGVLVTDRHEGKTNALVEWVRAGQRSDLYPFWTRVLVVPLRRRAQEVRERFGLDSHQVFDLHVWREARGINRDVEVAVDDVDELLRGWLPGRVARVSMTGRSLPVVGDPLVAATAVVKSVEERLGKPVDPARRDVLIDVLAEVLVEAKAKGQVA